MRGSGAWRVRGKSLKTGQIEENRLKRRACRQGFHDAYLTGCLLGYDLICRVCRRVRYRDVDPPEWAKYERWRALGLELDREAIAQALESEEVGP